MSRAKDPTSIHIKILGWYGIVFGCMYLLYAVVSIILSILDRTYADMESNFLIGFYGIPILVCSIGFKNYQRWGWIGYAAVLLIISIWSFIGLIDGYSIFVGIVTLAVLIQLFIPAVRKHYFPA